MKIFLYLTLFLSLSCKSNAPEQTDEANSRMLVFTKTTGYRHESIETGVAVLKQLGAQNNFEVEHSENSSVFNDESLKKYNVVVFLSTTGDILNVDEEAALERFIKSGNSFMGIHAAADTEYDWEWYGKLVGAYFKNHPNNPNVRNARIEVLNKSHISCKHLPDEWFRDDEWYNYYNINPNINVLLNLDETSYEGGENGENHPIAWYHEYDGGRAFYTGGGHTKESFAEPDFVQHLLGGILYCLKRD